MSRILRRALIATMSEDESDDLAGMPGRRRSRRGFLGSMVTLGALAASYGTAALYALQFLYPRRRAAGSQSIYITSAAALRRKRWTSVQGLAEHEIVLRAADDGCG
jgi:hypothetical protein